MITTLLIFYYILVIILTLQLILLHKRVQQGRARKMAYRTQNIAYDLP